MTEDVIVRRQGAIGRISLNRPKALHALTRAMCEAISAALLEWRDDPGIAAVILDHAEGRGFCAGGDVAAVRRSALEDGGGSGRPAREERVGTSRRNLAEAEACAHVLAELAEQPEARGRSVAVISFYKAQIGLLRDRLRRENLPAEWFDPARDVNTVDQFQGSERDIVIVSLVRTDARLTGEFVRDFRRINVAFSRARRLLIVLGNEATFGAAGVRVPGAKAGEEEMRNVYRQILTLACRSADNGRRE